GSMQPVTTRPWSGRSPPLAAPASAVAVLHFSAMKPALKTAKRKSVSGAFVFPDEALHAARRKPFKIDFEALRREGARVMTRAEFEEAKRRGPASLKTAT